MIEVRLFGPGEIKNGSRTLTGFPKQQYHIVLCYLIVNRQQPHPREKLASAFWTNYTTNTSRKYLRDALWRLRHALNGIGIQMESLLNVSESQVAYQPSEQCCLDLQQFEAGVQYLKGTPPDQLEPSTVEMVEQAVNLYTGDLLDGLYQDWCLYERERLRLLYLNALAKLMEYHEAHGDYEKAITYGECILSTDGTREAVHRQMMWLHQLMGNRDAAIRQYRTCVRILQETLGMPPLTETTQLFNRIANNDIPPAPTLGPPGVQNSRHEANDVDGASIQRSLARVRYISKLIDELKSELSALEVTLNNRNVRPSGM